MGWRVICARGGHTSYGGGGGWRSAGGGIPVDLGVKRQRIYRRLLILRATIRAAWTTLWHDQLVVHVHKRNEVTYIGMGTGCSGCRRIGGTISQHPTLKLTSGRISTDVYS